LTIEFLFPKQTGGKGDDQGVILMNGDVPQIMVKAPEAVLVQAKRREDSGRK
jgi:hypothetical protein